MPPEIVSGLFTVVGLLAGGLITYFTTRVDRQWDRAKRDIVRLCEQVSSYYQLEQLYKEELASLDPERRSARTIMEQMRTRVTDSGAYERPEITSVGADKIRRSHF